MATACCDIKCIGRLIHVWETILHSCKIKEIDWCGDQSLTSPFPYSVSSFQVFHPCMSPLRLFFSKNLPVFNACRILRWTEKGRYRSWTHGESFEIMLDRKLLSVGTGSSSLDPAGDSSSSSRNTCTERRGECHNLSWLYIKWVVNISQIEKVWNNFI